MVLSRRKSKVPKLPAYDDTPCPLKQCMALLGGAWTPSIIWNLTVTPRRFSELHADIPGISAKVLSSRLSEMVAKGVLARTVMPSSPPTVEYSLTELGRELLPVIDAIEQVGLKLVERIGGNRAPGRPPVMDSPEYAPAL